MYSPLRIHVGDDAKLSNEIRQGINLAGLDLNPRGVRIRIPISPNEIVVALGSAGAFTALYKIICKVLEKDKDREIRIEREGVSIQIRGHSIPNEKELLKQLAPELTVARTSKRTR